jgi:hypothetical protein
MGVQTLGSDLVAARSEETTSSFWTEQLWNELVEYRSLNVARGYDRSAGDEPWRVSPDCDRRSSNPARALAWDLPI